MIKKFFIFSLIININIDSCLTILKKLYDKNIENKNLFTESINKDENSFKSELDKYKSFNDKINILEKCILTGIALFIYKELKDKNISIKKLSDEVPIIYKPIRFSLLNQSIINSGLSFYSTNKLIDYSLSSILTFISFFDGNYLKNIEIKRYLKLSEKEKLFYNRKDFAESEEIE